MAKFGEEVRSLLEDVARFIHHSLKSVALPAVASAHRQKLIKRLDDFQNEHPQMIWDIDTSSSQDSGPASNGDGLLYDELDSVNKSPTTASVTAHTSPVVRDHRPPLPAANHGQPLQPLLIAASDIKDPAKCGFLVRKSPGLLMTKKKKTWCVIKAGVFYGFETPNSKSQLMSFPLKGSTMKPLPIVKGEYSFELSHVIEQKYTFIVTDSAELESWLNVINRESFVVADARLSVAYATTNDVVNNIHSAAPPVHAPVPAPAVPPAVPASRPVQQQPKVANPDELVYEEPTPPSTSHDAQTTSSAALAVATAVVSTSVVYDTPSVNNNNNKSKPSLPPESGGQSDSSGLYDEIPASGGAKPAFSAVAIVAASSGNTAQKSAAADRPLTYEMVPGDIGRDGLATAAAAAAPKAAPETRRPPPATPHPSPSPAAVESHHRPPPERPERQAADHPTKKAVHFAPTTADGGHAPTPAMRNPHSAAAPPGKRESRPGLPVPEDHAEDSSESDWYVARWDCAAGAANELTFKKGDHLKILSREYESFGWLVGQLFDCGGKKRVGLVPKDYVEKLVGTEKVEVI